MTDKKKQDFDIMPYWKNEEKCFEDAKVEGKDTKTGKKTTISWPRDKPIEQTKYETWLQKVRDPDTGKFYEQRDKHGNTIKGTGPKHLVRQIVRIRANDGKEWLYSNGKLTGFDVLGEVATVTCSNPETWDRTGFAYDKQFDQKTMTMKKTIAGPNSVETVYEIPFNEKNLKALFDKRMNDNVTFVVKEEKNNAVHSVQDATGIASKTFELFTKDFDYLYNADYISQQQKSEAIEMGLLPREAQGQGQRQPEGEQHQTTPPTGTYS